MQLIHVKRLDRFIFLKHANEDDVGVSFWQVIHIKQLRWYLFYLTVLNKSVILYSFILPYHLRQLTFSV